MDVSRHVPFFTLNVGVMRMFVLSSLFTSIWVWLYVGSIVTIRLLHNVRAIWVRMAPYLDIDKKPLVAMRRSLVCWLVRDMP